MKNTIANIITLITLMLVVSTQAFSQKSIVVQGVASISVANTQAKISTSVKTQAETADEAMTSNSTKVQAVIDALVAAGINLDDIKTSNFTFSPVYEWVKSGDTGQNVRVFKGYAVNNSLSIKVNDILTVGLILDLIVNAGASSINNVSFSPTDVNSSYLQALTLASQNAHIKAEELAQASSVSLGKAIRIISNSRPNNNYNGSSSDSLNAPPVILPNNNQISAYVTIEYAIVSND